MSTIQNFVIKARRDVHAGTESWRVLAIGSLSAAAVTALHLILFA